MTLIALRTGVAHLLSGRTPQIHALSSPYAASTRSLGAAALSPRSSPPQTFNHLLRSRILPRLVQASSGAATVQIPVTELQQTSLGSALWQQFAAAVTGEWEGITVTFTPGESGVAEPQELPSRYVPAAFACVLTDPLQVVPLIASVLASCTESRLSDCKNRRGG